jgi:hypothetical protein
MDVGNYSVLILNAKSAFPPKEHKSMYLILKLAEKDFNSLIEKCK